MSSRQSPQSPQRLLRLAAARQRLPQADRRLLDGSNRQDVIEYPRARRARHTRETLQRDKIPYVSLRQR